MVEEFSGPFAIVNAGGGKWTCRTKIKAVSRMQHYIETHLDEAITLEGIADAAGYSKYHAVRIFKELTGRTPFETIRALRLTKAAQALQSCQGKVVDVAVSTGFDSHDGFTRAFYPAVRDHSSAVPH